MLTVQKNAYLDAKDGEPLARDRCELRDVQKLLLGTPMQYSFDIRIDPAFPIVDARMDVAQIKAPYYDGNGSSPLFALRVERGHYLATIEHLYELKDVDLRDGSKRSRYLTPYVAGNARPEKAARGFDQHLFGNTIDDAKELQIRAIMAHHGEPLPAFVDYDYGCWTSGVKLEEVAPLPTTPFEWNRFRLMVAPTRVKDCAGRIEFYVSTPGEEERYVATAAGEFGHRGYKDPEHNTGPDPDQAYQYFKIGPYRDKTKLWGDAPATVHVRNIARRSWPAGQAFLDEEMIV